MRYALYFSPDPDHPLSAAAAEWLGRDAFTGKSLPLPTVAGLSAEELHALTEDPRRYGFHATLKAPFALKEGCSEAELITAMEEFAAETLAFEIPRIMIGQLGRFFALVPDQVYPELQSFAAHVVETFEPFRAPLTQADIARRQPERLTASERDNLERWGYPYVHDGFRFHMTLTGQVDEGRAPSMAAELGRRFDPFCAQPLEIDGLALFAEPERGQPFTVRCRLPLAKPQHQRKTAS